MTPDDYAAPARRIFVATTGRRKPRTGLIFCALAIAVACAWRWA